ncbi:hypothetical protein HYFRA_00000423 [Hymenoscyphus fraxineus]|uniref:Rhodopsin domain-containing protein n=1 Tax=Hymenoscyphus fraxineus TaxID=746836 RepID=A0A9N9L244_9HELO|nr:hypothetical protein HYFRA_00000423 [Hymenoscyphus fraxineus]
MSDFVTEAFTLLSVGLVTIGLRSYARYSSVSLRGFKPDDYIMVLAGVVYALETVTAWSVGAIAHGLANNGMTDEERASLVVNSPEWIIRVKGSKIQLIGWSLYTLLLWLLKFCMCVFYERLTEGVDDMKLRVRLGYVILFVTYLAVELSILFGCQPFKKNWQINPDPGNHCQPAISHIDLYVTVVLNVITDLYLMSIPLPMMWRANIPFRRKTLLIGMFSGGLFVMTAGILRCILILRDPVGGAQQAGSWAVRETFVAVVIGNIPMIYPFVRRTIRRITDSATFRSLTRSQGANSRADPAGEFHAMPGGLPSLDPNRKKFSGGRSMHPLTTMGGTMVTGTTMTGSQELIVKPEKTAEETSQSSQASQTSQTSDRHNRVSREGIYVVTETIVQARDRERGEVCPKPSTHLAAERPTEISTGQDKTDGYHGM